MGYYAAIKKAERDIFNRELKAAAFTAWRLELTISGLFGGQAKISYSDYLEKMGLLNEEERQQKEVYKKMQKAFNKIKQAAAMANIDAIIAADKAAQAEKKAAENGGG